MTTLWLIMSCGLIPSKASTVGLPDNINLTHLILFSWNIWNVLTNVLPTLITPTLYFYYYSLDTFKPPMEISVRAVALVCQQKWCLWSMTRPECCKAMQPWSHVGRWKWFWVPSDIISKMFLQWSAHLLHKSTVTLTTKFWHFINSYRQVHLIINWRERTLNFWFFYTQWKPHLEYMAW